MPKLTSVGDLKPYSTDRGWLQPRKNQPRFLLEKKSQSHGFDLTLLCDLPRKSAGIIEKSTSLGTVSGGAQHTLRNRFFFTTKSCTVSDRLLDPLRVQ